MKKETLRSIVAAAAVFIVYNLAVFVVPFQKGIVFWLSWIFTLLAFAVVCMSIYIAFIKNPDAKSRFYGFPIARIGLIYGLVQFIVSIVFMALGFIIPWWIAVLIYAAGLAATVIGLVSAEAVLEEINNQDTKLKKDVSLMRGLQSKVNPMASQCDDKEAAVLVQKFADELRYSDPVSGEALAEIEAELSAAVDELQAAIVEGKDDEVKLLCRKASVTLTERNRLCKLNKN